METDQDQLYASAREKDESILPFKLESVIAIKNPFS
jgi:hypothetical protein